MRIEPRRASAPKIVAVNDAVIASADIARDVQNQEGISPVVAWAAATRALLVRELLSARAGGQGARGRCGGGEWGARAGAGRGWGRGR